VLKPADLRRFVQTLHFASSSSEPTVVASSEEKFVRRQAWPILCPSFKASI